MKITVCILAKDEEEIIRECINSVKNFANEIILIDNGSSDNTKKIAIECGCIVKTCIEGSEADLRNEYLKLATGDWIFMIDADERVDEKFSNNLLNELRNVSNEVKCYSLPVNSYYGNGKWAYFTTHRLFRNITTIKYSGNKVHPTLRNSFQKNGYIPKFFPYPIHHLDALIKDRTSKKREGYVKKIIQNMERFKGTEDYYRLSCFLACEFLAVKKYEQAISILRETSKKSKKYDKLSNLYLMNAYKLKKDYSSLKEHINKVFFNFSDYELKDGNEIIDIINASGLAKDALDKIIVSICEYYLNLDEINNVFKWLVVNGTLNPCFAHNYINIASITTNEEIQKDLIKCAINLNPYLTKSIIYEKGCEPNIYIQQTSLLSISERILEDIKYIYN